MAKHKVTLFELLVYEVYLEEGMAPDQAARQARKVADLFAKKHKDEAVPRVQPH